MRIDKLLWFLRLSPSRSLAQQWVLEGHIRVNGRRIDKPSAAIAVGNVMTLPMRSGVRVIEICDMPRRRGPATEAQACYRVLDDHSPKPIAAPQTKQDTEGEFEP
ncbi:RNA-binding S4 domain-containing protein [Novosphingobium sp. TH158]|uniref:RNA-binding S4 domain-containing protein n=1 Tax=Novosphingobium sp. TH158 TaxID=2067455 RepID=UPI000C7CB545|nr:S4 domain-containing protein [Novosphingobium sp. TH158]PLK27197.1 RNA-binding protein [Novosphingobium sp. TH158]